MKRKYLDEAGIMNRHDLWSGELFDENKYKKQREEYGFDERELYDLGLSFHHWLYERLRMYLDITDNRPREEMLLYKNKQYSLYEIIRELIKRIEYESILDSEEIAPSKKQYEYISEIEDIWAIIAANIWM